MLSEKIQIWPDRDDVTLTTYILKDSPAFNPGKRRPAMLILPGGGYLGVSDRESEPIAMRFSAHGFHTFVLRYATYWNSFTSNPDVQPEPNPYPSSFPQPMYDAAAAIRLIRQHADEWLLDPDRITVCGFSAGGHLAASLGTMWHEPLFSDRLGGPGEDFRPNALILAYPMVDYSLTNEIHTAVADNPQADFLNLCEIAAFGHADSTAAEREAFNPINHVSVMTPPSFIWHTAEDALVPVENSLNLTTALQSAKIPFELHIFAKGQHGLALANDITAASPEQIAAPVQVWVDLALTWLSGLN
jgi:acetyl esterase/lipase